MAVNPASLRAPAARPQVAPGLPGLRTLRSARFRLLLALTLVVVGASILGGVLLRQAADPAGQYAFDFAAYHAAATDVAAGRSPYAAEMFSGPVPAQGAVLYKYPPLLAQLLVPLAGLPLSVAAAMYFVIQWLAIMAGVWLAARAGGAARSAETLAWSAVAATYFLPCFDTLWKGNVSGLLVLAVGLMLAGPLGAGLGAGAATLLKTTPGMLVVPALVGGRRALFGLLVWLPLVAISVLASAPAWVDFLRVLPNLVSGPTLFANNLAPHSLVAFALPDVPVLADAARLASVGAGIGCVVGALALARRPGGWPSAVALAVAAMLLVPSSTWYHYLAVLLPVAAVRWPSASRSVRLGLTAGASAVTVGVAWLPLAVLGAAIVVISALAAPAGADRRRLAAGVTRPTSTSTMPTSTMPTKPAAGGST